MIRNTIPYKLFVHENVFDEAICKILLRSQYKKIKENTAQMSMRCVAYFIISFPLQADPAEWLSRRRRTVTAQTGGSLTQPRWDIGLMTGAYNAMGTAPKSHRGLHLRKLITNKLKKRKYENLENDRDDLCPAGRSIEVMPWEEELKLNVQSFGREDPQSMMHESVNPRSVNVNPGSQPVEKKKKKKKLKKRVCNVERENW